MTKDGNQHQGLSKAELREIMESRGLRLTAQRAAVYDYLKSVHDHPTAEDVFVAVRKTTPGISLATVYNTLESLVQAGLTTKYEYGDRSSRYDIRTDEHAHTRCLSCHCVRDVEVTLPPKLFERNAAGNFQVSGYRLELIGLCAECRNRQKHP